MGVLLAVNVALTAIATVLRLSVSFGDDALAQLLFAEIPLISCFYSVGFTSALALLVGIVAIARGRRRRGNILMAIGHGILLTCLQVVATS